MMLRAAEAGPLILGALACVSCNQAPAKPVSIEQAEEPVVAEPLASSAPPAISEAAIEAARAAIWKEPKVRNVDYRPDNVVQWIVAVEDDGSPRHGYAGYICQLIGQAGALTDDTAVRISNIKLQRMLGGEAREASLGAIQCKSEGHLDDAPAVGA